MKVLVIGYGNPGRLDDGLGPALAEFVEQAGLEEVTVDSDYQLTVEDACTVAQHDAVIFADASVAGQSPFSFKRIEPGDAMSFTSHSCEPEALLALARDLFGKKVPGYALGIRGYVFNEFGQKLSVQAAHNLDEAATFIIDLLREKRHSLF